jgi:hypothetical protein
MCNLAYLEKEIDMNKMYESIKRMWPFCFIVACFENYDISGFTKQYIFVVLSVGRYVRRFTACKEPYRAWVRCFVGRISRPLFLTGDSPASLPDGSGCWIRMIRISALGREASHLLLIRTNLGYGTVLTAACALQGCNAVVLLLEVIS